MGAPTGLVCDLCAVASLRDPSLTLEDDARGHGKCKLPLNGKAF